MPSNKVIQKILKIANKVIPLILVAFTVFMMLFTLITVSTVDRNDRSILGTKFYIVQTDSMSKSENNAHLKVHFNAGDIVLVRMPKDVTALEPGDIISFMSASPASYGETVTHMIHEVKMEGDKVLGYVTYGTYTGELDEAIVEPAYILGKYVGKLPGVGYFFAFVKSTAGYIVCILIPFLLLILYNGASAVRLFRQYKQKQTEALAREKAEIAAERERTEAMLRELQALRDELAGAAQGEPPRTDDGPSE